ncbi:MAG: transglycosylase domain-containing protein, partial [Christensenellales bacterium]
MRINSRSGKAGLFEPRERDKSFLLSVVMMTAKMLFFMILLIGVGGSGVLAGVAKAWIDTTPQLDLETLKRQSQTSFIYDRYGNLITEYKGSENRIYASLDEIPQVLIDAVISIEDRRFYTHNGVDIKRIGGSLLANLTRGRLEGASTITTQLIKLTLLSSEQTYKRKLQEAYLALQLEKVMTKDEILEEYMNVIYLGGACYGVKIAAQDYFGKELEDLSIREAACLARIIRSPMRNNPRRNYFTWNSPEYIEERVDFVLGQMYSQGYITQDEYKQAMSERLTVLESSSAAADAMYDDAYYVEYAVYDVVTKMLRVENIEDTAANRRAMETKLRNGGYKIYTALDPELQRGVQSVITNFSGYPSMRYANDAVIPSPLGGGEYLEVQQPQAAAVVMDWSTCELVAVVGGRSEPIQKKQFNRAYQSTMPIGSSIKPISVYGPAFDLGFSPGTPVLNLPINIKGWDSELGYPQNYSTNSYNGIESLRLAINKSHNTATAHALLEYVQIDNSVVYLLKLGISPQNILATASGLSLGSSGFTMLELCAAYSAVANLGEYQEPYAFTQVVNPDGSVYIDVGQVQVKRQVFKQSTAWLLTDVLIGCVSSGGTGTRAVWGNITVAGKTGTNSNNIGVTFAGFTGYYACAVWIGSDNYRPLSTDATGGTYAAPLWAQIMKEVHTLTGKTQDRDIIQKSAAS